MKVIVASQHKRHDLRLGSLAVPAIGRYNAGDDALAVDSLACIHPVEEDLGIFADLKFIA